MRMPAKYRNAAARGRGPSRAAEAGGVQYTVRGVPERVDAALRRQAAAEHRSLNDVLRDALVKEAGGTAAVRRHHDLDDLVGTWVEDPAFDEALAAQDTIDPALWR